MPPPSASMTWRRSPVAVLYSAFQVAQGVWRTAVQPKVPVPHSRSSILAARRRVNCRSEAVSRARRAPALSAVGRWLKAPQMFSTCCQAAWWRASASRHACQAWRWAGLTAGAPRTANHSAACCSTSKSEASGGLPLLLAAGLMVPAPTAGNEAWPAPCTSSPCVRKRPAGRQFRRSSGRRAVPSGRRCGPWG